VPQSLRFFKDWFMNMPKSIVIASLAAFAAVRAAAVELDGIAAVVDGEMILKSEVVSEMKKGQLSKSRAFDEARNAIIERKLILKAAADAKMSLQSWVVDNRIKEITQSAFGGDRSKLLAALASEGIKYTDWEKRVREDMIVSAMSWNAVYKNVVATPAEMKAEYENNKSRYTKGGKVTISVILLKPSDAGKKEEISKALKTQSFADLARRYSSDSRAKEGGEWKDVNPEEVFGEKVVKEIAKMPVGTLSDWIDMDGWNFLLKKSASSNGGVIPFEEAYDDVVANVHKRKSQVMYKEWVERLKEAAYIKLK
jgi:parvulin-like peptidyl-prolyl isomerase